MKSLKSLSPEIRELLSECTLLEIGGLFRCASVSAAFQAHVRRRPLTPDDEVAVAVA